LNLIDALCETESNPELETLACGRICDEYIHEARIIQSSLIPTAPLCDDGIEERKRRRLPLQNLA